MESQKKQLGTGTGLSIQAEKSGMKKPDLTDSINSFIDDLNDLGKKNLEDKANYSISEIEDYLNTQIKEDPKLVKQLLRVFLSAYTDNPINLFIQAPSSDGKTYATIKTSQLFPKNDIIRIGRMTPTALIHQHGFLIDENGNPIDEQLQQIERDIAQANTKSIIQYSKERKKELLENARNCIDLKNKILLFLDNPNPATYEILKPIMSHDSKEIEYLATRSDSLTVKKTVIRNWPVFVFCSAKNEEKNEVWEEVKTRVFLTSTSSTKTKYRKANLLTSKKLSRPTWSKDLYEDTEAKEKSIKYIEFLKLQLVSICKNDNNPVINPYNELLAEKFPHSQGVYMRHFTRLLAFINIETMINLRNNPKYRFNTHNETINSVFTTIKDIDNAGKILGNISTISPNKQKFLDEVFKPLTKSTIDNSATSKVLSDKYNSVYDRNLTSKQILENFLEPLVELGILSKEENKDKKNENIYSLISEPEKFDLEKIEELLTEKSKSIEESKRFASYIESCLEELENSSIKIRKTNPTFHLENNELSKEELIVKLS